METRNRAIRLRYSISSSRWRAVIAAREAECRGGLETDNQLEFGRLLHADRLTDWSINGWKVPQPDSAISERFRGPPSLQLCSAAAAHNGSTSPLIGMHASWLASNSRCSSIKAKSVLA
jgi:hypothetical protein